MDIKVFRTNLSVYLKKTDLHKAWSSKNGYFIGLVCLMCVSFLLYLLSSLIDPGFLPKPDAQEMAIQASLTSEGKVLATITNKCLPSGLSSQIRYSVHYLRNLLLSPRVYTLVFTQKAVWGLGHFYRRIRDNIWLGGYVAWDHFDGGV